MHPASHRVDDLVVTVNAGVVTGDEVASITSNARLVTLDIGHLKSRVTGAAELRHQGAVGKPIGHAVVSVRRNPEGRQDVAERAVVVVVRDAEGVGEELDFEGAMSGDVLFDDEDGALAMHVAGGAARVLLIGVVILNGETRVVDHAAIFTEVIGIRLLSSVFSANLLNKSDSLSQEGDDPEFRKVNSFCSCWGRRTRKHVVYRRKPKLRACSKLCKRQTFNMMCTPKVKQKIH